MTTTLKSSICEHLLLVHANANVPFGKELPLVEPVLAQQTPRNTLSTAKGGLQGSNLRLRCITLLLNG